MEHALASGRVAPRSRRVAPRTECPNGFAEQGIGRLGDPLVISSTFISYALFLLQRANHLDGNVGIARVRRVEDGVQLIAGQLGEEGDARIEFGADASVALFVSGERQQRLDRQHCLPVVALSICLRVPRASPFPRALIALRRRRTARTIPHEWCDLRSNLHASDGNGERLSAMISPRAPILSSPLQPQLHRNRAMDDRSVRDRHALRTSTTSIASLRRSSGSACSAIRSIQPKTARIR